MDGGGSEAHLQQVFARAGAHQPAVILIDELDALASRRDGTGQPHHAQLVVQLLVLLDGLDARGQVVGLATTTGWRPLTRPSFGRGASMPTSPYLSRIARGGWQSSTATPRPDRRLVRRRVGGARPGRGARGHQARGGGGPAPLGAARRRPDRPQRPAEEGVGGRQTSVVRDTRTLDRGGRRSSAF